MIGILLGIGCSDRPQAKQVPGAERVRTLSWPSDTDSAQVTPLTQQVDVAPCRPDAPLITNDSIGPFRAGQTLAEVAAICPEVKLGWDWGDEGIPEPVAGVLLGASSVWITYADTLPSTRSYRVLVADSAAKTRQGLGPGATFGAVRQALGPFTLGLGECVLYAHFAAMPSVSWRLRFAGEVDCADLNRYEDGKGTLPASTRVRAVFQFANDSARAR